MQTELGNVTQEKPGSTPLVSIVVVTFNSAATVRETLDSLLQQRYVNLEIILCDDGSKDSTVSLMTKWRDLNHTLFKRIEILASPANQGICKNLNAGYGASRGDWVKPIAGDDILLPGAIPRYVEHALRGTASALFAPVQAFRGNNSGSAGNDRVLPSPESAALISGDQTRLLEILRVRNIIAAPGVFFNRADYVSIGGLDLRFKHLDDWPMWINFLQNGKSLVSLPDILVAYRLGDTISVSKNATSINRDFLQDHVTFYENYQVGHLNIWRRWDRMLEVFRFKLAKDTLREYPRIYKFTGVLRFLSPLYFFRRQ